MGLKIGTSAYLRYYRGNSGKFGHEFHEFELRPDGKLRFAINTHYKRDGLIRKALHVSSSVPQQLLTLYLTSLLTLTDDTLWPSPDNTGRQDLELLLGPLHVSYCTNPLFTLDSH